MKYLLTMCMALALLISTEALGGKLSKGVFGQDWRVLEGEMPAPFEGCVKSADPNVAWECMQELGTVKIAVSYGAAEGRFYSVMVLGKGYEQCRDLMTMLTTAWGMSQPQKSYATGALDPRIWMDFGGGIATWKFNEFSGECQVFAAHRRLMDEVTAAEKAKAASAAGGL